jgi:hypothetical protein
VRPRLRRLARVGTSWWNRGLRPDDVGRLRWNGGRRRPRRRGEDDLLRRHGPDG